MGKQKTIFDLFKEQEPKFSAKPSNDAWSKLEGKLNGKTKITPIRRINWWAIAAYLVALVGVFSILKMDNHQTSNAGEMTAYTILDDYATEDLDTQSFDSDFSEEWEVSKKYRAMFSDYTSNANDINDNQFDDNNWRKSNHKLNVKPSFQQNNK